MWGVRGDLGKRRRKLTAEQVKGLIDEESFARSITSFLTNIPFLTLGTLKMLEVRWSTGRGIINGISTENSSTIQNLVQQYLYVESTQPWIFPVGFFYGILFGLTHTLPPMVNTIYFSQFEEDENPHEVFDPIFKPADKIKQANFKSMITLYFTSCIGSLLAMPLLKYHTYLLINHLKNYSTTTRHSTSMSIVQYAKSVGMRQFFFSGLDIIFVWVAVEDLWKTFYLRKFHLGYWFLQTMDYFCIKKTNFTHTLALVLEDLASVLIGLLIKLPFRTLLYRMVDNPAAHKGLVPSALSLWRQEGVSGFYRGFAPALFNSLIPLFFVEVSVNLILNWYFGVPKPEKYTIL